MDPKKASTSILDQPPASSSSSQGGTSQGQGQGQGSNYRGGVGAMGGANNSNGGNMEGIAAWGKRVRDKQGSNKVTTFQVDFPGLSRNQVIGDCIIITHHRHRIIPLPLITLPPTPLI